MKLPALLVAFILPTLSVSLSAVTSPSAPDYRDRILTPPPGPAPRINGPRIFGVRPGSPVFFKIPVTGDRPLTFAVDDLPPGLALDPITGILTGRLDRPGDYDLNLTVTNASGRAARPLRIRVGDTIALTPPMGWNSWYCWSESVSQENVAAMARAMAASGLADHGWSYINIDDCWQGVRGGPFQAIQPNEKFPDIAALSAEIHGLGLKFGIYSTAWMGTYGGFIGGTSPTPDGDYSSLAIPPDQRHQPGQLFGRFPGSTVTQAATVGPYWFTDHDARQYAAWGVDYIKYDWKNWHFTDPRGTKNPARTQEPKSPDSIARISRELRDSGRDIVLSFSPVADWENRDQLATDTNLWRVTKDIKANWSSLARVFDLADWFAYTRPGHWCDPDMLQIGSMGVVNAHNRTLRPSPLTPDEQFTQVSLWSLLSAPLLLSCDLTALDPFTLSLVTNDEVIDIDQDSLGTPARRVSTSGDTQVWVKPMEDGSVAVGFFNLGNTPATVAITWPELGLVGPQIVRDVWRQRDVANSADSFSTPVNPHGVVLTRIRPAPAVASADHSLLDALSSPILLAGGPHIAYRDPLLLHHDGLFYLYFSCAREEEDHLIYWYLGLSTSTDLRHWTEPRLLTPRDQNLNYASIGDIVRVDGEWLLCAQTYPIVGFRRGDKLRYADDRARLFIFHSPDLVHWDRPELIRVKGPDVSEAAMGKMIDPFLLRDRAVPGRWWCFYKQNGHVQCSSSTDLRAWTPGTIDLAHGENPCVITQDHDYVLFYSPNDNGIGVKRSTDLVHWRDDGPPLTLGQAGWPWAANRITAGYVADFRFVPGVGKYVMVFHGGSPAGKRTDENENANCDLGIAWSDDLRSWDWPAK